MALVHLWYASQWSRGSQRALTPCSYMHETARNRSRTAAGVPARAQPVIMAGFGPGCPRKSIGTSGRCACAPTLRHACACSCMRTRASNLFCARTPHLATSDVHMADSWPPSPPVCVSRHECDAGAPAHLRRGVSGCRHTKSTEVACCWSAVISGTCVRTSGSGVACVCCVRAECSHLTHVHTSRLSCGCLRSWSSAASCSLQLRSSRFAGARLC